MFHKHFFVIVVLVLAVVFLAGAAKNKKKKHSGGRRGLKFLKDIQDHHRTRSISENEGLQTSVFNVATKALVSVNATCGERGREEYCKMTYGGRGRCGICSNLNSDHGKQHLIQYAIDGTNKWWQSPALYYGSEFQFVTIDLDLRQVYQITHIIIKFANSPRPGSWILERSLDGDTFEPWQFFATNDKECFERYSVPATKGKPHYSTDSEVICTSYFSRLTPLENGEIHIPLVQGRPGEKENSPELLEFTKARYVRIRLQGLRGAIEPIPKWLSQDPLKDKRLFYSIRDIKVNGQCVCNGHAANCRHKVSSGNLECECAHDTCGPNCEKCCPLFNQRPWGPGTSRDSRKCLPCNCHGHASSCHYDEAVDRAGLSLDAQGNYQGGGVCDNCTAFTTGINCEKCQKGYYRPYGVATDDEIPCKKCDCEAIGSIGFCMQEGELAGTCECKPGFVGDKCDTCAPGYRGYPECEVCPCDSRGILESSDCEGECICKENVEGKFCDRCKSGHFALKAENFLGCSSCYCSGVTTLCEPAVISPRTIETLSGWLISDLKVTTIEKPTVFEQETVFIGNYEQSNVESYYWLAPLPYLGNKLEAYDSSLIFKVRWLVMRGDTSGKPTKGPNIIIVGHNGMQIAYGDDTFNENNVMFNIRLQELDWYHVPPKVKDIVTRLRRTEYKGNPVTRQQFLEVLSNVKHILLRATYHTDQVECLLEHAAIKIGKEDQPTYYSNVEQCSCPSGYSGLSCESCSYGYVRMSVNTTYDDEQSYCLKCDCNGHSETCNPETGECFCQNNTVGEKCERCALGFYGNPLKGTPEDCKMCACPLVEESNNFSPSCQLDYSVDENGFGYVCTQCPKGYTGDHCEICDNGYFGDPRTIGDSCKLCDCNGGPCDSKTGQCLSCKGNTEGFKCEKCKANHYGNPVAESCQPCLCDPQGSVSQECEKETGQCECKERFMGRTCDRCEVGYGNVTALCAPCQCNLVGSASEICDPHTGTCECQPGIEGFRCDACQHLHYGFSEAGCQSCKCNVKGSEISSCDIITGQCRCKPNYIGLKCDVCQPGFWEHETEGCIPCSCNLIGSLDNLCSLSGQCNCQPGVGGIRCDSCREKYYGFSETGCKSCQPCNRVGHICDQNTGACVCPPLKEGAECQNCIKDTWMRPDRSCVACQCSETGSVRSQCNSRTGQCTCKQGYEGDKCDKCSHGYYGYPKCRRCSCNPIGTDFHKGRCDKDSICQCDEQGHCPCKSNVSGKRCNTCKESTFGLDIENPAGCTECFCFGRSDKCTEAGLTWDQTRSNNRILTLKYNDARPVFISNDINALREIPSTYTDVEIEPSNESPPYWRLPINFSGDLTLSYGGYLRFTIKTYGSTHNSPEYSTFPAIQIHGKKTVLEPYNFNKGEIKLHEYHWTDRNRPITREQLMVVLQNVTKILLKATDSVHFTNATLSDVSLDVAKDIYGKPPPRAWSVEKCECPQEYSGNSCQNPNIGYFRYFPTPQEEFNFTWIDKIVGKAKRCECNEFSDVCNRETGYCLNCSYNRAGPQCENCAAGYYMDEYSSCQPCQCPTEAQNFASSCSRNYDGSFICFCRLGYTGPTCNVCDRGYFGNPNSESGSCKSCNCDPDGSFSDICDQQTGRCSCRPGFIGVHCSQCEAPRHVIDNHRCTPCDNCTQILLDDLDNLWHDLNNGTNHLQNGIQPPWATLKEYERRHSTLHEKLKIHQSDKTRAQEILDNNETDFFENKLPSLKNIVQDRQNQTNKITDDAQKLLKQSEDLSEHIDRIKSELQTMIDTLNKFGISHESTKSALAKARRLLNEMHDIAQKFRDENDYKDILNNCNDVIRKAADLNSMLLNSNNTQNRLADFRQRLTDIRMVSVQTDIVNRNAEKLNELNKERIANLSRILEGIDLDGKVTVIGQDMKDIEELRNKINELNGKTESNYQKLKNNPRFAQLLGELEEKERHLSENLPEIERYLGLATLHVEKLERNVTEYKKILNFADEEWKKTIDTYRKLESDTNAAKEAALNARAELEQAYNIIKPIGKDSLHDKASLAYAASTRTLARVQNHPEITDFRNVPINIATAGLDLQLNAKMNNEQTSKLRQIAKNNKIVDLYAIIQQAIDVSAQMQKVYQNIQNINYTMYYEVSRDYQKYLNLTSKERMDQLKQEINVTRDHLKHLFSDDDTLYQKIKNFNSKVGSNNTRINSIEEKLRELRTQIEKAKKTADGIKVSLAGSSCSRTYMLNNVEPSIFTTIVVDINNVTNNELDYSLFHLENTVKNQYMDLKIIKGNIIFKWQLGKDPHMISLENNGYGKIYIERLAHRVTLKIGEESKVYREATDDPPIFYVTRKNIVSVGKETGLPGCLKDIIFNGHRIGFWNFLETQGECQGCYRAHSPETSITYFNGNGFSKIRSADHYQVDPERINLNFDITTFDENALLLLAPQQRNLKRETKCTTFLAVYLKDGHVQAEIHYSDRPALVIRTPEKFNTGTKQHVEILKIYVQGVDVLKLNEEYAEREVSKQSVLRIKQVDFYFGGVPTEYHLDPDFNACVPNHTVEGLLGSIEAVTGKGGVTIQLTKGDYFGLESQNGELKHKRVWFSRRGFVILEPLPVQNISFVIRTNQTNGFVLSIGEFTVFTIEDGKLSIKFLGDNESVLSDILVNDDDYYYVELIKGSNLKINGVNQGISVPKGKMENANIFLGHNPNIPLANFTGGISDLVINDELLYFKNSTIRSFANVKIGHQWKKATTRIVYDDNNETTLRYPLAFGIKDMQNTQGCFKITSFTLDRNAAKFGDSKSESSYVIHNVKNSFWKGDFSLEFQFRTFYPNGLIFLARNPKKYHYTLFELQDGKLQYQVKNNKRKLNNVIDKKVNNGSWHQVSIRHEKKKNTLNVTLDNETKIIKILKNRVNGELYIGGLPNDVSDLQRLGPNLGLHPFRGCIRALRINNQLQSLVDKHTRHNKIGQCFSNIEQGSYFGGDAYAIYKEDFQVDKILELSFEFRTTEQNGILLSISNTDSTKAISIELQSGAVVMTIDSGLGYVSNVTNSLTEYALCNNAWHNVSAFYSSGELTINVDGVRKSWVVQDDASSMEEFVAPLYIGGVPDNAPVGTLKIRENFKGCIRNIKIGEKIMDWTDMDELNNVLLNSCPVVA